MNICWTIRAWRKEGFFDRYLSAKTEHLPPLHRYTLEYIAEETRPNAKTMRQLRHLFTESNNPSAERFDGSMRCFALPDYLENASGEEMSSTAVAREISGNPNICLFPSHFRQHDIELSLGENSPTPEHPEKCINLSQDDIDCLAYFVRDGQEIRHSKFWRSSGPVYQIVGNLTAISDHSDELVRSFVGPFRRLYMKKEPGNFCKACDVYVKHYLNKRVTRWVAAEKVVYQNYLLSPVEHFSRKLDFTTKRLLDIFINTRYAHQPSKGKLGQFKECLAKVRDENQLVWHFCNELRKVSCMYLAVLQFIENELAWYLKAANRLPSIECKPLIDVDNPSRKQLVDARIAERFTITLLALALIYGRPQILQ